MKGAKTYEQLQEQLDEYILSHNMRPSKVRNMVLKAACQLQQPFTADALVEKCAEERISVGTVYNVLNLLILAQILHAIQRQRGKAATTYELVRESDAHMIVVCPKCGRESEFTEPSIIRLVHERRYSNFVAKYFTLVVYGECRVCRRKKRPNDRAIYLEKNNENDSNT